MFNFFVSLIIASQLIGPISGIILSVSQNSDFGFPKRRLTNSFRPVIGAESAIVFDVASKKILYEKEAYKARSIASLTKLMTAIVFFEQNPDLDKSVQITQDDKANGGKIQLLSGEIVKLKDILNTALIGSANNAAYELAHATRLGYQEFIARMNSRAREIGMKNSIFVEPTGIDPGNMSTAKDVAMMLNYAMGIKEIVDALSSASYAFQAVGGNKHYIKNTNELLGSYLKPIGGKTGYIEEAGYCLVNFIKNDQVTNGIIIVILGAKSNEERFQDNKFLGQWILDNWQWE